jgi:hypothetical protein
MIVTIGDLADGLSKLASIIQDTKVLVKAINDGRDFLKAQNPQAIPKFAALLVEVRATVVGLANVTRIVSDFKFNASDDLSQAETVRFNNYMMERRGMVTALKEGGIKSLKGNCEQIMRIREDLQSQAGKRNMASMFGLLGGKQQERIYKLSEVLVNFYGADLEIIKTIEDMLKLSEAAVEDVQSALLDGNGMMQGYNIPKAASRLQFYSDLYKKSQAQLDILLTDIDDQVKALSAS